MRADLATWRPLWDFAFVLFVLGLGGALSARDRVAFGLSQGVLLLSIVVGFAAADAMHRDVALFPLGLWIAVAWVISWIGAIRIPHRSTDLSKHHDGSL